MMFGGRGTRTSHNFRREKGVTKRFASNNDVARAWAAQSQQEGASGNGNLSFAGRDLVSYRTIVASLTEAPDGKTVCLVTSTEYSVSTSEHLGLARSAAWRQGMSCFTVPHLPEYGTAIDHAGNQRHLVNVYRSELARLKRKQQFPEWGFPRVRDMARAAMDYSDAFALDRSVTAIDVVNDWEALARHHHERAAAANAPEAVKRRQQAQKRRDALKEQKRLADEAKFADEYQVDIANWQNGGKSWLPYNGAYKLTHLRSKDGLIETSRDSHLSFNDFTMMLRFVEAVRASGAPYQRTWMKTTFDGIVIEHITAAGDLKYHGNTDAAAGEIVVDCYTIPYADIARVARSLAMSIPQESAA